MKKHQIILLALIIVSLLGLRIVNWYRPITIDKTIEINVYKMDEPDYELPLKIILEGKYYRRLFKKDFFDGQMIFDQYEFTRTWETLPISVYNKEDFLQYITFNENEFRDVRKDHNFDHQTLGLIWGGKELKEFLILFSLTPNNPHEFIRSHSQDTAIFTAYPSNNREEAVALLKKFEVFRGFK